jgi:D-sedoheptulose 7-phosphate isomerase
VSAISGSFAEHRRVLEASHVLEALLERMVDVIAGSLASGGKVLTLGNGGSAADAQHFASELVGRFAEERPGWAALALTVDPSAITSISNDFGFERVFSRQVEALARPGDVVVALSTSGRSPNVLAAVEAATRAGCRTIGLTGADGGPLRSIVELWIGAPSSSVPRIQEVHGLSLHAVAAGLEERLATRSEVTDAG